MQDLESPLSSEVCPVGVGREEMAVKAMLCAELWPHQIPDPALGTPGLGQEGEDSQSVLGGNSL